MVRSENDKSNKQTTGNDIQEEANIYEDEINLIDYLLVLWKHKWFILLGSIMPTLMVGLIIYFLPRDYTITYTYDVKDQYRTYDVKDQYKTYDVKDRYKDQYRDRTTMDVSNWNLDERNYNILISRFYSEENTDKIISKLRENGLEQYAKQIITAGNKLDGLKSLLKFEPVPTYIDLSDTKIADAEQLEKLRQLKALLLKMTIIGKPKNDIPRISAAIRDNLENVTPVYVVQEQLSTEIRTHKARLANIESNKFSLKLALKTNNVALEKLKSMKPQTQDEVESNVLLQFDVGGRSEYLPLGYQIQALESEIVSLEKQVGANRENYEYYKNLLALNEKLLAGLKKGISSYYTIQQYHSFLIKLIDDYEAEELKDYLKSYIKKIENRIAASVPITENPTIYPVAKGTVKKSAIVFVIALMLSVFVAFLLESLKKSQVQTS